MEGDHVAGHQRQMCVGLVRHRDSVRQLPLAEERTEMDIGQLHDPDPLEILGQARDERWLLVFGHDLQTHAGYLGVDARGQLAITEPVALS